MSIHSRLKRPATLHVWDSTGRDDATGDQVSTFPAAKDRPVLVSLRQQQTREERDNGVVVTSQWLMFLPPDVPLVQAQDEVTVEGMGRWAFEGDPQPVTNPRTERRLHWQGIVRKVG